MGSGKSLVGDKSGEGKGSALKKKLVAKTEPIKKAEPIKATVPQNPKNFDDLKGLTVGQAMQLKDSDLMGIKGAYGVSSKYRDDGTLNYATIRVQEPVKNIDLTKESHADQEYAKSVFQTWMSDVNGEHVSKADIDVDSNGITLWRPDGGKAFFSVGAQNKSEIYIEPNLLHGKTLSSNVYVKKTPKGLDSFQFSFVGSKEP